MRGLLAMPQIDRSVGVLGLLLVACAFAFVVFGTPPLPPAPMVMLGVPSPLTGMTRSFVAVARGDMAGAFVLHPLGPLCFAACVLAVVSLAVHVRTGRRPQLVERLLRVRHGGAIVAAAFGVVWIRQIAVFT